MEILDGSNNISVDPSFLILQYLYAHAENTSKAYIYYGF
jgi:hypothetical protein